MTDSATATQAPAVHAIIPAYGRPELLARALASLRGQGPRLHGVIVVNNSRDEATVCVARESGLPVRVLIPDCNLGTAGGIAWALRVWLADPAATHAWILDDDAFAEPGALDEMFAALRATGAEAAAPLIVDEDGVVLWMPGLCSGVARRANRRRPTPAQFRDRHGDAPLPWRWAMWASLLVTRRAVEEVGLPRLDLWSQFSDMEYTLRLTARFGAVLAPRAVCRHLPPPAAAGPALDAKLYSALQNGCYVTMRFRHGWWAVRHLPGLHYRYLRHYRWGPGAWARAVAAFWTGAVRGLPSGETLHAREVQLARVALAHAAP